MNKYRKRKAKPNILNCFGYFDEEYNPKVVRTRSILCNRIAKFVLGLSWEEFIFGFFIFIIPYNFSLRCGMLVLVSVVFIVLTGRLQNAFDLYWKKIKSYEEKKEEERGNASRKEDSIIEMK